MPKIMAIDDSRDNLVSISALLRNLIPDSNVITALSGSDGIKKVSEELPDVILLDVQMPGMDGYETCRRLKADEKIAHIPVIMLTALKTGANERVKGLRTGADAFLSKPIDESEMVAQVNVMLRIKSAEDKLRGERDLLEKKVLERTETLRESEERYRMLFNNANDAVFVYNVTPEGTPGSFTDVNSVACKSLGYTREELLDKSPSDITIVDNQDILLGLFKKFCADGNIIVEWTHLSKDGRKIPVEINAHLFELQGQPAVLSIARDITERKRAEELIQASLKEKEVLLSEIHHRVKNNMQIIISILNLQLKFLRDEHDIELFKETKNRIYSMALIHEKLYQSRNFSRIDFKEYLKKLSVQIFYSYKILPGIEYKLDIEEIFFSIDIALPCAQIVNELVTNSLKYAFPEAKKGEIRICFNKNEDGKYVLIISDNGIGMPNEIDIYNTDSLGLKLVNALVAQLHGNFELDNSNGARFLITF